MKLVNISTFGIPKPTLINGQRGKVFTFNNKFYGVNPSNGKMSQLAFALNSGTMANAKFQTIPGPLPNWATLPATQKAALPGK